MKEFSREDFTEKLKTTRKQKNMTQEDISKILGIKRNTYARYETDTYPAFPIFYKICKVLSVSADYFFEPIDREESEEREDDRKL